MEIYDGQIISVPNLKKRWKCDFDFIFSLYAEYNSRYSRFSLPAWKQVSKRKSWKGEFVYILSPVDLSGNDPWGDYDLKLSESEINNIFFKLKDIERIEADQPALLYEPVEDPTIAEVAPGQYQIDQDPADLDQDQVARLPDGLLVVNPDAAKLPNALPLPDAPQPPDDTSSLESELAECQKRIAELESTIAGKDKIIAELRAKLDQSAQGTEYESFFEAYPICREMCAMHNEGKSRAEIVKALTGDDNKFANNLLAGWITKPDLGRQSAAAIKQAVKRLKNPSLK